MNLAWVIPKAGKPQLRNVHAKDRTRLAKEGLATFTLEWSAVGGRAPKEARVYAPRVPTAAELRAAADELFGARGAGALRLLDADGAVLLQLP